MLRRRPLAELPESAAPSVRSLLQRSDKPATGSHATVMVPPEGSVLTLAAASRLDLLARITAVLEGPASAQAASSAQLVALVARELTVFSCALERSDASTSPREDT
jgi:hypothetical protein